VKILKPFKTLLLLAILGFPAVLLASAGGDMPDPASLGYWVEVAKRAPDLLVLGAIVYVFLKHIEKSQQATHTSMKEISDQCHSTQRRGQDVIEKNSESLLGCAVHLEASARVLERVEKALEKKDV